MFENCFRWNKEFKVWLLVSLACALCGCSGGGPGGDGPGGGASGGRQYVTLGTAPIGGAFRPVGDAISAVLNEHQGAISWKVEPRGTKGSQQNIRELDSDVLQLAMSNSAISYYAVRGEDVWDKSYDLRAVVTLAPNVGLFITKEDSGIQTIGDLKGKRVVVGPGGAGFHMFLGPLLTAHGVTYEEGGQSDFTPLNGTYSDAVQLLGDGNADAAFMGGATPIPAVVQACRSYDIRFVAYDESVRQQLIEQYPFYNDMVVPAKGPNGNETYAGITEDFVAMNVGSMHLITTAGQDEELIYQITKTIWENRAEIVEQHRAGLAINEDNAARYTGTEFHPGAIRFYKEIGIWPEEEAAEDSAGSETPDAGAEADSTVR
jgi:TRAP transporter TAXI family solute receptor